jgi:hypothetical protein
VGIVPLAVLAGAGDAQAQQLVAQALGERREVLVK